MAARPALRLAWPSTDVMVPDLLLLARRATGEVVRVLVWPERVGDLVLPAAADQVVIRGDARPGAPPPAPSALIPLARVLEILGEAAARHEEPVPHWLYRGGDRHPLLVPRLRAAAGEAPAGFRAVASETFLRG